MPETDNEIQPDNQQEQDSRKREFYKRLKEFMSHYNIEPWGYFDIIIKEDIYSKLDMEDGYGFDYLRDHSGGYTQGTIEILLPTKSYYYTLVLYRQRHLIGYCNCLPQQEGYNEEHQCCGTNCDWYQPGIILSTVINGSFYEFQGIERDLWALEKQWHTNNNEYEKQKIAKRIDRLDQQRIHIQNELSQLERQYEELSNSGDNDGH